METSGTSLEACTVARMQWDMLSSGRPGRSATYLSRTGPLRMECPLLTQISFHRTWLEQIFPCWCPRIVHCCLMRWVDLRMLNLLPFHSYPNHLIVVDDTSFCSTLLPLGNKCNLSITNYVNGLKKNVKKTCSFCCTVVICCTFFLTSDAVSNFLQHGKNNHSGKPGIGWLERKWIKLVRFLVWIVINFL